MWSAILLTLYGDRWLLDLWPFLNVCTRNEYNIVTYTSIFKKGWDGEGLQEFGTGNVQGEGESLAGKMKSTVGALGLSKNWCWLIGWVSLCLLLTYAEPILWVGIPRPLGWSAWDNVWYKILYMTAKRQSEMWTAKSYLHFWYFIQSPPCFSLGRQVQF